MFSRRIVCHPLVRYLHSSVSLNGEINKQLLSKLRKTTGFPFINCKKALEKFDNDIKQAEKWLRDEAQKEGWTKATKLQGRPMSQGLIGLKISDNLASIVEINCETDFVARNVKFQNFVALVVDTLLQQGKTQNISKAVVSQAEMNNLKINERAIADLTALEVGNLGENIMVRRGILLKPPPDHLMSSYIHATGPKLQQRSGHCILGKYGALVVYKTDTSMELPFDEAHERTLTREELGRQLCQHVVGMNPKSIGQFSDQPLENIDDETRLLHQEFMSDTSLTVKDILRQYGLNVVEFVRMECGEDLPAEKESETKVPDIAS